MRAKLVTAAACAVFCALAAHARADLYQWTDAQGRVHVTDDRSQIPAGSTFTVQPSRTPRPAPAPRAGAQNPAAPDPHPVRSLERSDSNEGSPAARTHVLHYQRAGHEIALEVALADRVGCDFKVDTGASLNTVPMWVVKELGIEIDKDTPRISVVGISGRPALVPVVTMPSVRVGTVYVENVEMAVLDTMSTGLLGMPFFNHYKVQIDPAKGELRLTEIDLENVDGVYGGMNEDAWRMRFRQLHERLALIRRARAAIPDESETMAQNAYDKLDDAEAKVQAELDALEDKAQAAGLPGSWR